MTISATIVFLFTSVLFLSGLFLQQQTVKQFHAALAATKNVHGARPHPSPNLRGPLSSLPLPLAEAPATTKAAYAQLVSEHHSVCASIMLFSELHRSGSKFERVLMYPKPWDEDPQSEMTRELLKAATERYGVLLRPVEPIFSGDDDNPDFLYPSSYLWSLTDYARILTINLPGLLINPTPLDNALATIQPNFHPLSLNTHFLLLRPNATEFVLRTDDNNNDVRFRMKQKDIKTFYSHFLPLTNTAAAVSDATYISMTSPSPSLYLLRDELLAHENAPLEGEMRNVWEGLYERYSNEGREVCGSGPEMGGEPSELRA
ncbi:MAG: hypothetical protein M1840_000281 [Geoglossum simile]|nr:MAG: hypothetical protein M1840_000281 [Geoglossum simile]